MHFQAIKQMHAIAIYMCKDIAYCADEVETAVHDLVLHVVTDDSIEYCHITLYSVINT